jgi:hypothetical protein
MDETGVPGRCHGQWVIVPVGDEKGRFTNIIGSHGDQEHIIITECVSTEGQVSTPSVRTSLSHLEETGTLLFAFVCSCSQRVGATETIGYRWIVAGGSKYIRNPSLYRPQQLCTITGHVQHQHGRRLPRPYFRHHPAQFKLCYRILYLMVELMKSLHIHCQLPDQFNWLLFSTVNCGCGRSNLTGHFSRSSVKVSV